MTVPRHRNVQREICSGIQRELMQRFIHSIYPTRGIAINIGGPRNELHPYSINVDCLRQVQNPGAECEMWSKDICSMGERMPIKSNSLSAVYSCHSLEHMIDTKLALVEWLRVLKPSGLIIVIVPVLEYHTHNTSVTKLGDRAPSEHKISEFKEIADAACIEGGGTLLAFNTLQNNFDIDIIIRKNGSFPSSFESVDMRERLDIIKDVLCCPYCHGELELTDFRNVPRADDKAKCKKCDCKFEHGNFNLKDDEIWEMYKKDRGLL